MELISQYVRPPKMTLKRARRNSNMTLDEVSRYTGITPEQLIEYERDVKSVPCSIAVKFKLLYRISLDDLFED